MDIPIRGSRYDWEDILVQVLDYTPETHLCKCLIVRGDGGDFPYGAFVWLEPEELVLKRS